MIKQIPILVVLSLLCTVAPARAAETVAPSSIVLHEVCKPEVNGEGEEGKECETIIEGEIPSTTEMTTETTTEVVTTTEETAPSSLLVRTPSVKHYKSRSRRRHHHQKRTRRTKKHSSAS
jgi:hypothetical protein